MDVYEKHVLAGSREAKLGLELADPGSALACADAGAAEPTGPVTEYGGRDGLRHDALLIAIQKVARLARSGWRQPNVLLLDEPTSYLDLDMRETLVEGLSDFDRATVLVSQDSRLFGLVCDLFWRVVDDVVQPFDGDLDQYAGWLRGHRSSDDSKEGAAHLGGSHNGVGSHNHVGSECAQAREDQDPCCRARIGGACDQQGSCQFGRVPAVMAAEIASECPVSLQRQKRSFWFCKARFGRTTRRDQWRVATATCSAFLA